MIDYRKLDGDIRTLSEDLKKNASKAIDQNMSRKKLNKNKKHKMKKEEINDILEDFRADILTFINTKNVGIRYAFKRFDKDNDGFISFTEFENALQDRRFLPFFEQYETIDGIIESNFFWMQFKSNNYAFNHFFTI